MELTNKKYQIIYADPPWDVLAGPPWSSNGKSQPLDYPTMTIDEIKDVPVKEISADDSHLYLWIINKYIKVHSRKSSIIKSL